MLRLLQECCSFNEYECTCLHSSSILGCLPIVEYLIEKALTLKQKINTKKSPLRKACRIGHLEIVQYLIKKGTNIEEKDQNQWTPLHYESQNGSLPMVEYHSKRCSY